MTEQPTPTDMKKQEIQNEIEKLFDKLSSNGKVETLASLYWEMTCFALGVRYRFH